MIKSIVFVINTYGDLGGHYYSLITTAEELHKKYNIHIVNIGKTISPVIEQSKIPHTFLFSNYHDVISVTIRLLKIFKQKKADVVHAFDRVSYLYSLYASWIKRIPLVVTKCGGPIIKLFPFVSNIVVFTKEDYYFFSSKSNSYETSISFVPNRVAHFHQDIKRIEQLKNNLNINKSRVILRIGRIDTSYQMTAFQCIRLAKSFHKIDSSFVLLIIGNVANQEVFKQITEYAEGCDYIHIVTDRYFTINAKELIDIAEIVVGTGRNFMEACSMGKTMMAPNKDEELPVLVTSDNFDDIFNYNFSERYQDKNNISTTNLLNEINGYREDTKRWYDKFFSSKMIESSYSDFYNNLKPTSYIKIFKTSIYQLLSIAFHSFREKEH